jgi:aminoglycoside phosphotransferase
VKTALRLRLAEAPVAAVSERTLCGHSGARILLVSDGRDAFVRKTAASAAASARLKAQADKQHGFWTFGLPFPKVRSQSIDEAGIGSFEMNYLPGRTIADAVLHGGVYEPAAVTKAVERLMRLFTLSQGDGLPAQLFQDKIHEVAGRGEGHAVRNCAQLLLACDWSGIPQSPCHGDLTLENILLTAGGSIAFIDCDETFASSWWLDFGKLFQDLDGHWCIRGLYDDAGVALLNAIQKLDGLGVRFRRLADDLDGRLAARLPQLAALGLFRAIPYARSEAVRLFICRRIQHVLEHGP